MQGIKETSPESHFLREISLKSRTANNLNTTFMKIKELRKRVQAREKQEALEADLVTQAALQLIKTGKVHRLRDCYVRPNVGGKKSSGTLELHANGLRFVTGRGEKLDIIFKNVKLALFQVCGTHAAQQSKPPPQALTYTLTLRSRSSRRPRRRLSCYSTSI